jgi:3-oxoadipate enol-lactonase
MPNIEISGVSVHCEMQGEGAETIVFAHGLLWSGKMFEAQMASLKPRYRCISFDFRGQGQTAVTRSGYDTETLFADTVGIIEKLNAGPCHFVGVSMGGFIGLCMALRRPELIISLALFATSTYAETENKRKRYCTLTLMARIFGLRMVADKVMPVMFGKSFINDPLRAE